MRPLLIGLLLLWAAPVFSEESNPSPSENKTEPTETNSGNLKQSSAPAASIPAPVINVYTAKHAGEESHCSRPKDWKEWPAFSWCEVNGWLDAERVIAVFTVVLGIATWLLWRATDRLVEGADQTARRQLRAYISVTPKKVFNWKHEKYRVGVGFDIENHGQTIGFEICHSFSMAILDFPLADGFVFPETARQYDQNNSLFPRAILPVRLWHDTALAPAETQDVESASKAFFTWGVMTYRDSFGKERSTNFCFSFGGPDFANVMKGIAGAEWNWELHPGHNDAT